MPTSIHHHHHHPLLRATLSFPTFPFAVLFRQTSSPIPLPNAFVKRWNKLVDNSQIPAPRLHRPRKLPLTNVLFIPPRHGSCTPHSANFITSSSSTRRSFFLPSKTFGLRSVQTLPSNQPWKYIYILGSGGLTWGSVARLRNFPNRFLRKSSRFAIQRGRNEFAFSLKKSFDENKIKRNICQFSRVCFFFFLFPPSLFACGPWFTNFVPFSTIKVRD